MAKSPLHEVAETGPFLTRVGKLKLSESEHDAILDAYQTDPDRGEIIAGTGGVAKGRIAKDGSGKSGGYRVFSFYINRRAPVFLLWIIDKTDEENVTDEQKAALKKVAKALKDHWSKR